MALSSLTSRAAGPIVAVAQIPVAAVAAPAMTVHHARVVALAVLLLGIGAFADRILQARQTSDETRALAEQGDARAQVYLGFMYVNGLGVPQDNVEAVWWYRRAAEQGSADAQSNLGFMYGTGAGVPPDYVAAHMWFNLAAARLTGEDRNQAVTRRDIVAGRMSADQLAEAERRAREWQPTPEP